MVLRNLRCRWLAMYLYEFLASRTGIFACNGGWLGQLHKQHAVVRAMVVEAARTKFFFPHSTNDRAVLARFAACAVTNFHNVVCQPLTCTCKELAVASSRSLTLVNHAGKSQQSSLFGWCSLSTVTIEHLLGVSSHHFCL